MKKYAPIAAAVAVAVLVGVKLSSSLRPRLMALPLIGRFFA